MVEERGLKKKVIQIEAKSFEFVVDWVGKEKLICVIERGFGFQSRILFQARIVEWVVECLLEAISLSRELRLIQSRKEGSHVVLVRRRENNHGRYVLLLRINANGKECSMAIPTATGCSGWENFRLGLLHVAGAVESLVATG